jgi:hypothetical protein
VVYENDYTSPSNASPTETISYFHIVTNTDAANTIVDFADRLRYWRSKVTQGSAWNDINSTEAVNNARGAFPDDYYTITVTARDAAGNVGTKTQKVLLDNWLQVFAVAQVRSDPADPPGTTRLRFTGSEWTANATVKLYRVGTDIAEGNTISQKGALLGTANTDADGFFDKTLVVTLPGKNDPPYQFLGDYHHGDDIYQPRLDAIAPLQKMGGSRASFARQVGSPFPEPRPNTADPNPVVPPVTRGPIPGGHTPPAVAEARIPRHSVIAAVGADRLSLARNVAEVGRPAWSSAAADPFADW